MKSAITVAAACVMFVAYVGGFAWLEVERCHTLYPHVSTWTCLLWR